MGTLFECLDGAIAILCFALGSKSISFPSGAAYDSISPLKMVREAILIVCFVLETSGVIKG